MSAYSSLGHKPDRGPDNTERAAASASALPCWPTHQRPRASPRLSRVRPRRENAVSSLACRGPVRHHLEHTPGQGTDRADADGSNHQGETAHDCAENQWVASRIRAFRMGTVGTPVAIAASQFTSGVPGAAEKSLLHWGWALNRPSVPRLDTRLCQTSRRTMGIPSSGGQASVTIFVSYPSVVHPDFTVETTLHSYS